jgi:hypothetical protein
MAKFNIIGLVKKHPIATTAVAGTVFIGVYLLASQGASSGSGSVGTSTESAAQVAADEQEQTNQDQLTAQNNQNSFQLAYLQQQQQLQGNEDTQSYNLGLTSLADQLTTAQQQLATQLATTEYTTNASTTQLSDQLNAQVTINNQNNQTALAQQQSLSQEQEFSIAAQSQVESLISNNQTLVANNQLNATTAIAGINAGEQEYIAKTNAGVQSQNGILGLLGSIF